MHNVVQNIIVAYTDLRWTIDLSNKSSGIEDSWLSLMELNWNDEDSLMECMTQAITKSNITCTHKRRSFGSCLKKFSGILESLLSSSNLRVTNSNWERKRSNYKRTFSMKKADVNENSKFLSLTSFVTSGNLWKNYRVNSPIHYD